MKKVLEEDIANLRSKTEIPAISMATVSKGEITQELTQGKTVTTHLQDDVDGNTIFEAASLSKPLFAYLVLKLAQDGVIDLDKSLADVSLPNVQFDKSSLDSTTKEKFTARNLLSHQTGLEMGREGEFKFLYNPSEAYRYSGSGYFYLQKVIEHATGKSLEQLAKEYVFVPLQMNNSSFIKPESFKQKKIAVGHKVDNQPDPKSESYLQNETQACSANSLHTTAHDYALFVIELMKDAKMKETFISAISMNKDAWAHAVGVPKEDLDKLDWGLGWGLQKTELGKTIAYHWGDMGESKAFVALDLTDNTGIVYFTNSHNGLSIAPDVISNAMEENLNPLFNFLFKKYGYEDHKAPDWKIKQALGTWHNWGKYEMHDKVSFMAKSIESKTLDIHPDIESRTLTIKYDPEKTGIFSKLFQNEFKIFKYHHQLEDEDCKLVATEEKGQLSSLSITLPSRELFSQFLEALHEEQLLPQKPQLNLKKDESPNTHGQDEKSFSTTAKLMTGVLARDSNAPSPMPNTHPNPTQKEALKPTENTTSELTPASEDETKTIFKTPTLKPSGYKPED